MSGFGGVLVAVGGPSKEASAPKGPRKAATAPFKARESIDVGDVIVSFSSSSITLSRSPDGPVGVWGLFPSELKGFELAAKGLVNVGPDMTAKLGIFEGVVSGRVPLVVALSGYRSSR